jgi:hypothetical protein
VLLAVKRCANPPSEKKKKANTQDGGIEHWRILQKRIPNRHQNETEETLQYAIRQQKEPRRLIANSFLFFFKVVVLLLHLYSSRGCSITLVFANLLCFVFFLILHSNTDTTTISSHPIIRLTRQ